MVSKRRYTAGSARMFLIATAATALTASALLLAGPSGLGGPPPAAAATTAWTQFGDGPAHSGTNAAESLIAPGTVGSLKPAFQATLPGTSDGAPVVLPDVATAHGTVTLLFLTTKDGWIVALDGKTGAVVWSHQNGPGGCRINNGSQPCYTTSSPAIDPSGASVYSYGLDGKVHKYAAGTGAETIGGGWPELATAKPYDEKSSPALTIATVGGTSYLYVANGGYPGDRGDYQGHVTTIDLATGAQNVFNTLCSDKTAHLVPGADCANVQSAVWARPSVDYDARTNRIYFSTGNGRFDGAHNWGDSVLALKPDGTGTGGGPVDSYTPSNQSQLDAADLDLGSTSPAIVPAPAGSSVSDLGVQGGKDANLRLLNLSDLSGQGAPGHTGGELQVLPVPQGGGVFTQPATWVGPGGTPWVFVADGNGISGLQVVTGAGGAPALHAVWKTAAGGTSPIIANGVGFYLTNSGAKAFDPTTGRILWSDTSGTVGLHWQSPVVVNGYLYYSDGSGHLRAFDLPASAQAVTRIAGDDRFATSAALSAATYTPGVAVAYVASGTDFPDALSGAPAAGRGGGPVLLVRPDGIPSQTASELGRLKPGRIVVLGGTAAVGSAVQTALQHYTSGTVTRIAGSDRSETSASVSRATAPASVAVAYIASGLTFPDALAGGALAAGGTHGPLLLVTAGAVPASVSAELTRLHPGRIVVIGGPDAVGDAVLQRLRSFTTGSVTRLAGSDRYATGAAISATFAPGVRVAYVAAGTTFPDALSAAAPAGKNGGPLLLVTPGSIPSSVASELTRLKPHAIILVGGTAIVSNDVEAKLSGYVVP